MAAKKLRFDINQDAYLAFRNIVAERTSSVVAWVGSGLSRPAGIPTWSALKEKLVDVLIRKINTLLEDDAIEIRARCKAAQDESNFWVTFEILRKALGTTSYRETIRAALQPGETASIPQTYANLWKLPLGGVLNLNLDRLATRAFTEIHTGKPLNEFLGKQAGENAHLLKSPHPFLANLHGIASQESSWVFTQSELRRLQKSPGYKEWLFVKSSG